MQTPLQLPPHQRVWKTKIRHADAGAEHIRIVKPRHDNQTFATMTHESGFERH